jgi:hypothetical protein
MNLGDGLFDIQNISKENVANGFHVSEIIGGHMQYMLAKYIRSADQFKQIAYSDIKENETKKTLNLLVRNKTSPFVAYENEDEFLSILGTVLGSGVLNTLTSISSL